MRKFLLVAGCTAAMLSVMPVFAGPGKCGDVSIAQMNWASAEFIANVDQIILEKGYGCNAKLVQGDTVPTFTSMNEKGTPDIAPEYWANASRELLNKATQEGRLQILNKSPITGAGEGWYIPPHTAAQHPELKTVLDVINHPELFPDKEDPSKGAFIGCPAGWGCQLANDNLFKAFDMEKKGWKLINPGSAAGLDGSMAKAVQREDNWFGYYWQPTSMIGKYKMHLLDWGVPFAGSANWNNCIALKDCADPKPSAWTKAVINTVVTSTFIKGVDPAVEQYLSKRTIPATALNAVLVYMEHEQATGKEAAEHFLTDKQYKDVWQEWVTPDTMQKIQKALKQ